MDRGASHPTRRAGDGRPLVAAATQTLGCQISGRRAVIGRGPRSIESPTVPPPNARARLMTSQNWSPRASGQVCAAPPLLRRGGGSGEAKAAATSSLLPSRGCVLHPGLFAIPQSHRHAHVRSISGVCNPLFTPRWIGGCGFSQPQTEGPRALVARSKPVYGRMHGWSSRASAGG